MSRISTGWKRNSQQWPDGESAIARGGPAHVLGSSGGAVVGLELAVRHPEQVHTLVAHEPPVVELLPDAPRWRAFFPVLYETYRRDGVGPAMQKFGEETGRGGKSFTS